MSEIDSLIPRSGLLAWHAADAITSVAHGGIVTIMPDKSGNGRDVECDASYPTLSTNYINGKPAVIFSGANDPLSTTTSILVKHAFVVAAYSDAAFPAVGGANEYAGLLSGVSAGNLGLLVGNPSSTRFYDFDWESMGTYTYRRRDVAFAENNLQAAFNNAISIFEISLSGGWGLNGIQFGRDRVATTRKWKGPFCESLLYSEIKTGSDRLDIYEYLAMKYLLWKRVASGLDVWPFQPNWGRPLATAKRILSSTAVSGAYKSRTKSTAKKAFEPQFESRWPEEYDAAHAFWNAKYPGTSFIYRDYAFSPERDTTVRFASDLPQQANDYRDINYSFQAVEV